jgi:flavin-dependent dehydrogenase
VSQRVTIVGAGPAGSAAAIIAALRGLEVTLLDAAAFPRDRPGEALHPGVRSLFDQLGVRDQIEATQPVRNTGLWIARAGTRRFEPFAPAGETWHGYQLWRADLDSILLERARTLGARVLQPARALDVDLHRDRVIGISSTAGDIVSDFVFDATGPSRWLARRLHVGLRRDSPPLLAQFGYVRGECPARDEAPLFEWVGQGWTWTARVRPQMYQWTRLLHSADSYARDWLPVEFRDLEPVPPPRAVDVTWHRAAQLAGPGWFLLGDAAAGLDPASSHGVLRALMTGMQAAWLVGEGTTRNIRAPALAAEYEGWLTSWLEHDVAHLRELYGAWRVGGHAKISATSSASDGI